MKSRSPICKKSSLLLVAKKEYSITDDQTQVDDMIAKVSEVFCSLFQLLLFSVQVYVDKWTNSTSFVVASFRF